MTQRNPMNERYQSEDRKGATRKSAASAKPVSKAASSVRIQSTKKTPQQKKAERKQQRAKDAERDRQFYNPPTAEYKRLRKIWWVCLILAIILTVVSFAGNNLGMPAPSCTSLGAGLRVHHRRLYIDMGKCRKRARSTPTRCSTIHQGDACRREEGQAQQRAAEKQAAEQPAESEPQKKGLFGFGKKKKDE